MKDNSNRICKEDGCEKLAKCKGLCQNHYSKLKRLERKPTKKCAHPDGCPKFADYGRSYCSTHEARRQKQKDLGPIGTLRTDRTKNICKIDGCNDNVACRGFCQRHYRIDQKSVPGSFINKNDYKQSNYNPKACQHPDGCTRISNEGRKYCSMHRERLKKQGSLGSSKSKIEIMKESTCEVDNCGLPVKCKNMCMNHYNQSIVARTPPSKCQHPDDCPNESDEGRKYCPMHRNRLKKGEIGPAGTIRKFLPEECRKIRMAISSAIAGHLKKNNGSKNGESILNYLPFTMDELKEHLESLFEPWMNFQNRGTLSSIEEADKSKKRWHIDHIVSHSQFNYTSMDSEEFRQCWSLSNLRPLCALENVQKNDSSLEEWENKKKSMEISNFQNKSWLWFKKKSNK